MAMTFNVMFHKAHHSARTELKAQLRKILWPQRLLEHCLPSAGALGAVILYLLDLYERSVPSAR